MFATAGWPGWCWAVTQSIPAITPDDAAAAGAVEDLHRHQLDALGHAVGGAADRAGHVRAVTVAVAVVAVAEVLVPQAARPPKALWVVRMPVSMM